MEFLPTREFGSTAEEMMWNALRSACGTQPGYCWHHHPITTLRGNSVEPDIVLLHPVIGLTIIEVKGCRISDIESIDGYTWYMIESWYESEMAPLEQAKVHMYAVLDRLKLFRYGLLRKENGDCKIYSRAFVALPFVTEQEWIQRFGSHISAPKNDVIFSSDLVNGDSLWRKLTSAIPKGMDLTEEEWNATTALLVGSEGVQPKVRRPAKRKDSRAAHLRQVEDRLAAFDIQQHRFAIQLPPGPQRLRGLAGTGKTVVLAQKAAQTHVHFPDWDIAFTFYTRSLYGQVRELITKFVHQFSNGEISAPNWDKIQVLHGWGASKQLGLYRSVCQRFGYHFRTYTDASQYFATQSAMAALDSSCQELLEFEIPEIYDAIFIDEGQDFGKYYFQMCYHLLRQPKRIVWGYDEVQSLEALAVPTAEELFGRDATGVPVVDLDGSYPNGIEKDQILYHCYRNPRPVLLAAHAFGLGLVRKGGAVQFINTVGGWQDIGYELEGSSSDKLKEGEIVTLHRIPDNSPHHLEQIVGYHNLVERRLFQNREDEISWIADDIRRNIFEEELKPEEIVVISLDSRKRLYEPEFALLQNKLQIQGIDLLDTGSAPDTFRREACVSFSSIFRAKGNEGSLVYVYGFERSGGKTDTVKKRNTAFTAMTRTKGWLVLTGIGDEAKEQFVELDAILEQVGKVTFVVPDIAKIQRNLETFENQRRRERNKKAEKSMSQLIKDLADVDPSDLSEDQKKILYRILFNNRQD